MCFLTEGFLVGATLLWGGADGQCVLRVQPCSIKCLVTLPVPVGIAGSWVWALCARVHAVIVDFFSVP